MRIFKVGKQYICLAKNNKKLKYGEIFTIEYVDSLGYGWINDNTYLNPNLLFNNRIFPVNEWMSRLPSDSFPFFPYNTLVDIVIDKTTYKSVFAGTVDWKKVVMFRIVENQFNLRTEMEKWKNYVEIKAIEEASELQKTITKNMTFGLNSLNPYTEERNIDKFLAEFQDLYATLDVLLECYGFNPEDIRDYDDSYRKSKMIRYYKNVWSN